ncbi:hypothetical protein ScPMuIL_009400 [Solemya velum]
MNHFLTAVSIAIILTVGLVGAEECEYDSGIPGSPDYMYCGAGCCGDFDFQYCCYWSVGGIVGAVIGSLIGLAVLITVVVCLCIRSSRAGARGTVVMAPGQPQVTVVQGRMGQPNAGYNPYNQPTGTAYPQPQPPRY